MSVKEETPKVLVGVLIGVVAVLCLMGIFGLAGFIGKTSSQIEILNSDIKILKLAIKKNADEDYDHEENFEKLKYDTDYRIRVELNKIDALNSEVEYIKKQRAYDQGVKHGTESLEKKEK